MYAESIIHYAPEPEVKPGPRTQRTTEFRLAAIIPKSTLERRAGWPLSGETLAAMTETFLSVAIQADERERAAQDQRLAAWGAGAEKRAELAAKRQEQFARAEAARTLRRELEAAEKTVERAAKEQRHAEREQRASGRAATQSVIEKRRANGTGHFNEGMTKTAPFVTVDGATTQHSSVRVAFKHFGLPDNKHKQLRVELKAEGRAEFIWRGKAYVFTTSAEQ